QLAQDRSAVVHVDALTDQRGPATASAALALGRPFVDAAPQKRELEVRDVVYRGAHRVTVRRCLHRSCVPIPTQCWNFQKGAVSRPKMGDSRFDGRAIMLWPGYTTR